MKKIFKKSVGLTALLSLGGAAVIAAVPFVMTSCGELDAIQSELTIDATHKVNDSNPFDFGNANTTPDKIRQMIELNPVNNQFKDSKVNDYFVNQFLNVPTNYAFKTGELNFDAKSNSFTFTVMISDVSAIDSPSATIKVTINGLSSIQGKPLSISGDEITKFDKSLNKDSSVDSIAAVLNGEGANNEILSYVVKTQYASPNPTLPEGVIATHTPFTYENSALSLIITLSAGTNFLINEKLTFEGYAALKNTTNDLKLDGKPNLVELVKFSSPSDQWKPSVEKMFTGADPQNLSFNFDWEKAKFKEISGQGGKSQTDYNTVVVPLTVIDSVVSGETVNVEVNISGYAALPTVKAETGAVTKVTVGKDSPIKEFQGLTQGDLATIAEKVLTPEIKDDKNELHTWAQSLFTFLPDAQDFTFSAAQATKNEDGSYDVVITATYGISASLIISAANTVIFSAPAVK